MIQSIKVTTTITVVCSCGSPHVYEDIEPWQVSDESEAEQFLLERGWTPENCPDCKKEEEDNG